MTKAARALARAPARAHGLHRRQALRPRRQAGRRMLYLGLFTSTAYTRSVRAIPYLRRKVDSVIEPRRLRSRTAIPARRWSTCWKTIRATSCSRSTRTRSISSRSRSCSSTSGRACACCRGAIASTASCPSWSTCRATATTARSGREIGDYLAGVYKGRRVAPSIRSFRKARWCACISSSRRDEGETPNVDRATLERAVEAIVRTWTDDARRGARRCARPEQGARAARALSRRLSGRLSRGLSAADRASPTSERSRALSPNARSASISTATPGWSIRCAGLKVWSREPADPALRARAGAGEHGLHGRRRAHLPDPAAAMRGGGVAARHDARERADGSAFDLDALKDAARSVLPGGDARAAPRTTATTRWCSAAGLHWRDVALDPHASRATCARSASPIRRTTCGRRCASMPASRRRSCSCSTRASIRSSSAPADERAEREAEIAAAIEDRAAARSRASTRTASCAASSTRSTAALRTNFYQPRCDGQPKATIAIKFDSRKLDGTAAAAAALRDLRLFAARRRRASALRQGRARRHPLVGPAAGFPHRGARPGEGAAGQERRDRAGRRQGRLLAQAAAARRRRARRCRPKAPPPTGSSSRRCSTSPTISSRTAGVVPPHDVVRHDGDDPYLVVAADKGTATFSDIANDIADRARFLARRCLRLRRLGRLRPQEDGHHRARRLGMRSSAISARWTSTSRPRRSRVVGVGDMSGDVFGNGMLLSSARSSWSPPSTTATSSSIPIPIRSAASPSASGCSSCRARAGRTTTRR